jgi:hypothetical protein
MNNRRTLDEIAGQRFYVENPEKDFTTRVFSWLKYLGIEKLFPDIEGLTEQIYQLGHQLRSAGDASFTALADSRTGDILIRPSDYCALLHASAVMSRIGEGSLFATNEGAFALIVTATGDYEGRLQHLFRGNYSPLEKRRGRIIAEASMVFGKYVFNALQKIPQTANEAQLCQGFAGALKEFNERFLQSGKSVVDYLVEAHGLTRKIAEKLLQVTGDTKETIVGSTSQYKKLYIGAFKALTSFYHINLGFSLDDAIKATEAHFDRDDALTVHRTLSYGAQEVMAKLQEYGYPLPVRQGLCYAMINNGGTNAIDFAAGLPKFVELTGNYGPKGGEIMAFALQNPAFFKLMAQTGAANELLEISHIAPEQVTSFLEHCRGYNWTQEFPFVLPTSYFGQAYRRLKELGIFPDDIPEVMALSAYLSSMRSEDEAKLLGQELTTDNSYCALICEEIVERARQLGDTIHGTVSRLKALATTPYRALPPPK